MKERISVIKNTCVKKILNIFFLFSMWFPLCLFAADNPWDDGTSTGLKNQSIISYVGGKTEEFFKWGFALLGVILIAVGIIIIIHRLNEDTREKHHANLMWTIVMVLACIGIGLALIIFAWTHGLAYKG